MAVTCVDSSPSTLRRIYQSSIHVVFVTSNQQKCEPAFRLTPCPPTTSMFSSTCLNSRCRFHIICRCTILRPLSIDFNGHAEVSDAKTDRRHNARTTAVSLPRCMHTAHHGVTIFDFPAHPSHIPLTNTRVVGTPRDVTSPRPKFPVS